MQGYASFFGDPPTTASMESMEKTSGENSLVAPFGRGGLGLVCACTRRGLRAGLSFSVVPMVVLMQAVWVRAAPPPPPGAAVAMHNEGGAREMDVGVEAMCWVCIAFFGVQVRHRRRARALMRGRKREAGTKEKPPFFLKKREYMKYQYTSTTILTVDSLVL